MGTYEYVGKLASREINRNISHVNSRLQKYKSSDSESGVLLLCVTQVVGCWRSRYSSARIIRTYTINSSKDSAVRSRRDSDHIFLTPYEVNM